MAENSSFSVSLNHQRIRTPGRPAVCKVWIHDYRGLVDIHSFGFTAGAIMTVGLTSEVGPAAYVGAEARPFRRFSFEVQIRGVFPARVVYTEPIDAARPYAPGMESSFWGIWTLLVPCFRLAPVMLCGVTGLGLDVSQSPVAVAVVPNVGIGPRVGLELPFSDRFAARAGADLMVELPSTYERHDVNLQWTQSWVVGMVWAGLVVSFK
jgi:hypothetical protein